MSKKKIPLGRDKDRRHDVDLPSISYYKMRYANKYVICCGASEVQVHKTGNEQRMRKRLARAIIRVRAKEAKRVRHNAMVRKTISDSRWKDE